MMEPGTILLDKYRIERLLGEGGMGVVVLARHLRLDHPVAIKFLRPEVLDNQQIVQRFLREAQSAVKLESEHVCRVHDVGTLASGAPYIVMEYMEGTDLDELLKRDGALETGQAVDFLLQACEALAEVHALGIVHRDIKPANFFITKRPDGTPMLKVLDFGIAKSSVGTDMALTNTQAVMGTPWYMSPEQMRSSRLVDARTDIWALGVVLYELVSGRRPFQADSFSGIYLQVATEPMPPLDDSSPPGLRDIVERCLAKNPKQRFQNVAELAAALAPYARTPMQAQNSTLRTARVLGVEPHALVRASDAPTLHPGSVINDGHPVASSRAEKRGRSFPTWLLIAIGLGMVAMAAGAMMILTQDSTSSESAEDGRPMDRSADRSADTEPPAATIETAPETSSPEPPSPEPPAVSDDAKRETDNDLRMSTTDGRAPIPEPAPPEASEDDGNERRASRKRTSRRERSERRKPTPRTETQEKDHSSIDDLLGTRQ